jgi:predicted unusual protein kinase regulating ubiquinone biosynthesis (AarF/ABC1/UbiB family)
VANLARGSEASQAATDARVAAIAAQLVRQLGQMKGAAMKVGQVLSTVELEGLSPEAQREFKSALAELRDNVPRFEFEQMRAVIESDLGAPIERSFAEFEEEAFAAASIGQVHRARTLDGEDVAVKVQYPGIAEAVESDLRNIKVLMRLAKRIAPGLDADAVAGEVKERISEELDYELEAQNQRTIERAFRGHPFALVPAVHTSLSTRRVLVTDFLDGRRFDDVIELDEPTRDRFGESVFRFFLSTRNRTRMVLGDPRVGFLDFGLLRRVPPDHLELEASLARAIRRCDAAQVHALLSTLGYLPEPEEFEPEALLDQVRTGAAWLFEPGFRRLDPAYAQELLEEGGSPRSPHYEAMKRQTMPPASLLMRRQEALILIVLAQLRAGADWPAIAAEYSEDGAPSSELGRAEAEFWGA